MRCFLWNLTFCSQLIKMRLYLWTMCAPFLWRNVFNLTFFWTESSWTICVIVLFTTILTRIVLVSKAFLCHCFTMTFFDHIIFTFLLLKSCLWLQKYLLKIKQMFHCRQAPTMEHLMVAVGGLEPPPAPSKGVYGFRVRCPTLDDTALKSSHSIIQKLVGSETNQPINRRHPCRPNLGLST